MEMSNKREAALHASRLTIGRVSNVIAMERNRVERAAGQALGVKSSDMCQSFSHAKQ
jgi:hypothetical protein